MGHLSVNVLIHGRCRVRLEHHFCLFMLILRPNFDDALANTSTILGTSSGSSLLSGQFVRSRLQKAVLSEVYLCLFVFALKCAIVKRSTFLRDWM